MSLDIYKSTTLGDISGDDYMDQIADLLERLFGYATIPLASIGGTGDAITAAMPAGETATALTEAARFSLLCAAANSGPVTLNVASTGDVPVLSADGAALTGSELSAGHILVVEYRGSDFYIVSDLPGGGAGASPFNWQEFTSSGTWPKPAGLNDDTPVRVRAWGAGGGGGASGTEKGGGGGGAFVEAVFRLGDLPSSVAVTIGAGGAAGSAGAATSFGALLTAAGGAAGSDGAGGAAGKAMAGVSAPLWDGGAGSGTAGGASAVHGGAGGGKEGLSTAPGGASLFGGNGGAGGAAGQAPGGGGGGEAAGARGELWVIVG